MTSHIMAKPTKGYTDEAMSMALAEVRSGTLSLRASAKKYSVPASSLSDRNSGKVPEGAKWGGQTLLSKTVENELIKHAMERATLGIGFTKSTFLRFAGKFASQHGVHFTGGVATEKWWRGLKERHPDFCLRSPEATSSGRHMTMTRESMCGYFAALKGVLDEHDLFDKPTLIWNMDETGLTLAHRPAKIIAKKGTKAVHSKVSMSRELVTVIACGNASGSVIPPHVIIPGKTQRVLKGYAIEKAPDGTNLSVSDSGWTKAGIGQLWFTDTFLPNIGHERPQVLIMDGNDSHNHVEFLKLARENNIIMIELPSKTSHWTQPFDRTVFKSLKANWNANIQEFMSETGVSVGHAQFFRMLTKSWNKSMTISNISSGFVATGICPYNPDVIQNDAYTPAELYVESEPSSTTLISDDGEDNATTDVSLDEEAAIATTVVTLDLGTPSADGVIDLPLSMDDNGTLTVIDVPTTQSEVTVQPQASGSSTTTVDGECSSSMALRVVESALTEEMKRNYRVAYDQGNEVQDSLFYTWKMYMDRSAGVTNTPPPISEKNSMLTMPLQAKKPQKRKSVGQYFVISCDEAYMEKQKVKEDKDIKQKQIEERKLLRIKIKEEKENLKKEKMAKKTKNN